jgi:RNA polymerase sigma factor (sigma-70 family)
LALREFLGSFVTQIEVPRHLMIVEEADAEVYRKHADDLIRFATGLVGPADAGDVVADAVLSCLCSVGWTTVNDKRQYLYRSVYNQAAEFHRSSTRRRNRESRLAQPGLVEAPELRPEVLAAVKTLSVKQRAVIFLTYWEDLDPFSIAALMAMSEGSVKRHLARGRARLKEALSSHD